MHREGSLDADAVALLAHGERLADATPLTADHRALEHLDTLLGALDDLDMHVDGVARAEGRDVVAQRRLVDEVQPVHREGTSLRSRLAVAPTRGREALYQADGFGLLGVSRSRRKRSSPLTRWRQLVNCARQSACRENH